MKLIQKYLKKNLQYKQKQYFNKKKQSQIVFLNKKFFKPIKKKKKWKNWRQFKKFFLFKKKIFFFAKLKWRFNNLRILWHHLTKVYLPTIKKLTKHWKQKNNNKFYFFLNQLETRVSTIVLRSRFCYKLVNSYNSIKLNLITINGIIINKIWFLLSILDLLQKRRTLKYKPKKRIQQKKSKKKTQIKLKDQKVELRTERFKWRRYHWNKSRYILWKIRRISHFNMYFSRKQNTILNYLEINYKIPALILIKQPFLKELYLNKQPRILTNIILKKIYFIY